VARRILRWSTMALVLVLSAASMAGEPDWSERIRNGEWYFTVGRLRQAEAELRAALELANRFPPGDPRLERTLEDLGRLYEHEGRNDEAQATYQLLLAAVEQRAGTASPELLGPLAAVGRTALRGGDVPTAREAFERYAALGENAPAADPDELRSVLATLARMEVLAGDEAKALAHQRRAVALLDAGAPTDTDRVAALRTLGGLELTAGDPARGETVVEDAARIAEESDEEGVPEPAAILLDGARIAAGAAHADPAVRLAQRALDAHPDGTIRLEALGVLADAAWDGARRMGLTLPDLVGIAPADPTVARARTRLEVLNAAQEEAGTDARSRAVTLDRLARVAAMQGDTGAALEALDRLEALGDGAPRPPDLVPGRIALLEAAGRREEALEANTAWIASMEASRGSSDSSLIPALERQERLLTALGRKKEARKVRKRLKRLRRHPR